MRKQHILIADDDPDFLRLISFMLTTEGYAVQTADDGEAAVRLFADEPFDCVLVDMRLPGMSGMDVLERITHSDRPVPVILITAYGSVDTAVQAMKQGAFDYVAKPPKPDELKLTVKRAMEKKTLEEENARLREDMTAQEGRHKLLGDSPQMRKVFGVLEKVVDTDVTVLLRGESGTGKELVARAIHFRGPRAKQPFVVVNCSAIPDTLLESELFGHEKGSFTGATAKKIGKFELADGGTLFLDEIGDMCYDLQAKLLRVLQDQEFERVGGNERISVDVRVISATNKNLEDLIEKERFREDLYYRLNVVPVFLPPLRDREGDIPFLAEHFLRHYSAVHGKLVGAIAPEAMDLIRAYGWPGNVRELENTLQRAVVTCDGDEIGARDLPFGPVARVEAGEDEIELPVSLTDVVEDMEKKIIVAALVETDWVQARAARLLNVTERILGYKIKKYNITRALAAV